MIFGKRKETPAALPESQQGSLGNGRGNERADMRLAAATADEHRGAPGSYPGPGGGGGSSVPGKGAPAEPELPYQQTSKDPLEVGGPLPPSIGRCADLYSDVRALRLAMEKEVEAVKAREHQIREHIISNLSKTAQDGDSGASGLRYRAQIVTKEVPRAMDWPKIHAYIAKNNRFDLLQKRLGEKAVMDMIEDKQSIPGIEVVIVPDVSITKIGR